MPSALLDFSRQTFRERFSSPVLSVPVLTFNFDRGTEVTHALLDKLNHAREVKAVVVAAPQAVKSLLLKWAEVHSILLNDKLLKSSGAGKKAKKADSPAKGLFSGFGWGSKKKKEEKIKRVKSVPNKKTKQSKHLRKLQQRLARMKHTAAELLKSEEV